MSWAISGFFQCHIRKNTFNEYSINLCNILKNKHFFEYVFWSTQEISSNNTHGITMYLTHTLYTTNIIISYKIFNIPIICNLYQCRLNGGVEQRPLVIWYATYILYIGDVIINNPYEARFLNHKIGTNYENFAFDTKFFGVFCEK